MRSSDCRMRSRGLSLLRMLHSRYPMGSPIGVGGEERERVGGKVHRREQRSTHCLPRRSTRSPRRAQIRRSTCCTIPSQLMSQRQIRCPIPSHLMSHGKATFSHGKATISHGKATISPHVPPYPTVSHLIRSRLTLSHPAASHRIAPMIRTSSHHALEDTCRC